MAYDESVADRVRQALKGRRQLEEKRMFGGLAFMLRGHMICGVLGDELMLRVGPDAHDGALAAPHVRPMDFTGKPMRGFVFVEPAGFASERDLKAWVEKAVDFSLSLRAK